MASCDYCVKDLGPVVEKNACLSLMHSERPKLYTILAFLSAIGLTKFSVND